MDDRSRPRNRYVTRHRRMVLVHRHLTTRLAETFRWIDPGPESTHLVSDTSGWWRDPEILARIGPELAEPFRAKRPTVVVAPEVTGFLLGPLVAVALGVGFVPAYKNVGDRRIADRTVWAATGPDYRQRRLVLGFRERHVRAGDRVLLVDDWVDTGAQLLALHGLVIAQGAEPVGAAAIVADCPLAVRQHLRLRALLTPDDLPDLPAETI